MIPSTLASEDRSPIVMPTALARCRSVLMVGPGTEGMGGVASVVLGYIEAGLFARFHGTYVATHHGGSALRKMRAAAVGWGKVLIEIFRLDAPLVHVMLASRVSFWRKSVVCLLARAAGRPYLLHVHSGEFIQFYENESSRAAQWIIRRVFSRATLVLALSEEWRRILLRISPDLKIEVLPNGVPLPEARHLRQPSVQEKTVLALSRLSHLKGTYDLVRAFARIAAQVPRLRLVCGGHGDVEEVRALAKSLELEDRIVCPGWLGPERKRAELADSDIFVLPSYAEGMPMAVLEAMSWGLPVITTPVGAIVQLIQNGVDGILVEPGDVEAIATAILRLSGDPALRARMGAAARATIEARFSINVAVERLSGIYGRFGIAAHATAESS